MNKINNYILKNVGDEYMIIPVSGNNVNYSKVFNVNETSAFIFENLKKGLNKTEVLELMVKEYNAPKEVIEADLDEFINELIKRDIYEY